MISSTMMANPPRNTRRIAAAVRMGKSLASHCGAVKATLRARGHDTLPWVENPISILCEALTLLDVKIERVAKKSRGFAEAEAWDIEQHISLTPRERMRAARALKDRLFRRKTPDVRQCHPRLQAH